MLEKRITPPVAETVSSAAGFGESGKSRHIFNSLASTLDDRATFPRIGITTYSPETAAHVTSAPAPAPAETLQEK